MSKLCYNFDMEFFVEVILELYVGFFEMLMPERALKKWQSIILRILSVIVTVGILACIAVGIDFLIEDGRSTVGLACTAVGCSLFAVQTVLFILVFIHQFKEEKRKKKGCKKSNARTNDSEQTEQSGRGE